MYIRSQYWLIIIMCWACMSCVWMAVSSRAWACSCVCVSFSALHDRFLREHRHLQDPTAEVGWHQEILFFCIGVKVTLKLAEAQKTHKKNQLNCTSLLEVVFLSQWSQQVLFRPNYIQVILSLMFGVYNFSLTNYFNIAVSFSLTIHFLQVFFIITAFFGTGNIASINRYVHLCIYIWKHFCVFVCKWQEIVFVV